MSVVEMNIKKIDLVVGWQLSDGEECAICKKSLLGPSPHDINVTSKYFTIDNEIVRGDCKHLFHKQCITDFINGGNSSCPIDYSPWSTDKILTTAVCK